MINASTNIYIYIIPDGPTLQQVITDTSVSQGFYPSTQKAFFFINPASSVASVIPQGVMSIFSTEGSYNNVTAFKAKLPTALEGSATIYDAVISVARAIERLIAAASAVNGANLISELDNTDFVGYSGPFSFDSAGVGYREVQTFNVSNVFQVTPTRSVTTAFTWDGILRTSGSIRWPGSGLNAPGGFTTIWPVGFISAMMDSRADMINTSVFVPLNTTAHRSFVRFAVEKVNELLPPTLRISTPPLNDNGTASGAVRVSTTISASSYIAMVGTWDSPNTKVMQGVLSAYEVPQLSYSASDPTLSNKGSYPTLVRISPSDIAQTRAIADMINSYGWTEVSVITSTTAYGLGLDSAFQESASGFSVANRVSFVENQATLTAHMKTLKDSNANILVALLDPKYFIPLLAAMREVQYAPRAVIVSDRFFMPFLWQHELDRSGLSLASFAGWVGMVPAGGFEQEGFANLSSLVNSAVASRYPSMKEGFAESPDYCAFIYDSFLVIGDAIQRCLDKGCNPRNGAALLAYIKSTNIVASTGRIAFDKNLDRKENKYVQRFIHSDGTFSSVTGLWNGLGSYEQRSSVVWPSGSNVVPIAVDPRQVKWLAWNSAAGIALAVCAGLGILFAACLMLALVIWRESPLLISSTYPFLVLILLGIAVGYGSIYTWIGEPKEYLCALRIWLPPIAFVMMLAPLLAKTWRLHRIFTLGSLKTTPIPLWKLVIIVAVLIGLQVAICIAWISAGSIKPVIVNDKNDATVAYKICTQNNNNRISSYVTYGYLGLLMLIGAYYAFRVRNLPKDFNESRWIGFSIYNTLLFSIVIVILGYALVEFRVTVLILICVCTIAITTGVAVFMMAPKFWDLILHPDKRSGSGNTRSGSLHTTSPHTPRDEYESPKSGFRRHDYSLRKTNTVEMGRTNTGSKRSQSSRDRKSKNSSEI
jgi:ABC-type branched-subunit amino acid transport system substrate-binding protein